MITTSQKQAALHKMGLALFGVRPKFQPSEAEPTLTLVFDPGPRWKHGNESSWCGL